MASLLENFPNLPPAIQDKVLDGPALMPPDGVTPNLLSPPNRNVEAIVVAVVCLFLSTTATVSRAYSRIFVTKRVEMQDYLGLAAFGSYIVLVWVYLDFLNIAGFFVHQWDITFMNIIPSSKILTYGLTIAYSASLLFAKTAILIEWMRLFSPHRTHAFFYWTSYLMICLNGLLILVLPQRIIWTLQMTRARKVGISLIFSVGLLATVCAAGRVAATFAIEYEGDATYTVSPVLMWALPEVTCVLLVFCLPTVPKTFGDQGPLFKVVSYVRSWTRLPSSGSRKLSGSTKGRRQPETHAYAMMGEDGNAMSLAELGLKRSASRKGSDQ